MPLSSDYKDKWWNRRSLLAQVIVLMLLAVVVGIVASAATIGFYQLMLQLLRVVEDVGDALRWSYVLPLFTIAALMISTFVLSWFGNRAAGLGIPDLIASIINERCRLDLKQIGAKTLASAVTIGWGGAVGIFGPVAVLGGAIGSIGSRLSRLPIHMARLLIGCGAAAAISAAFDAPLSGVLFATEVVLREFDIESIVPLIVASIVGAASVRFFSLTPVVINVPVAETAAPQNLPLFLLLGVLAGLLSIFIIRFLYFLDNRYKKVPIGKYGRAALAGAVIGGVSLFVPELLHVHHGTIAEALLGQISTAKMIAITLSLPVLLSFTLAGGGAGGVFGPCLAIGATLGGTFGYYANRIFSGPVATIESFAVVGSAALFAGVIRAPFTAILLIAEVTGNHTLLLSLMTASVVSIVVSKAFERDSIYIKKLTLRGEHLVEHEEMILLTHIYVSEVMSTDYQAVQRDEPAKNLVDLIRNGWDFFPVIDDDGRLEGMISTQNMMSLLHDEKRLAGSTAIDLVPRSPYMLTPDSDLLGAFREFGMRDVPALAVVNDLDSRKLLGVVLRQDLYERYEHQRQLRRRI